MVEKPKWTPKIIEGGKSKDAEKPKVESDSVPLESVPEGVSISDSEVSPDETIVAEELMASLMGEGGWMRADDDTEGKSEISKESDLIRLYMDLSRKPPADFAARIRPDRQQEAARVVRSWTVAALHKYLSSSEVWNRPSYTKAIFEEVRSRMLLGTMSPRE